MDLTSRESDNIYKFASLLFWFGIAYYALALPVDAARFAIAFVGGSLVLYLYPKVDRSRFGYLNGGLLVGSLVTTGYFFYMYPVLNEARIGWNTTLDYVLASILIAIVVYLTYVEYGSTFLAVILVGLGYAYFGPLFPSWLYHAGLGIERLLQTGLLNMTGVYGDLTQTMGMWIALFLLYAGLIQGYGGIGILIRASQRLSTYVQSGVAQMAVIASIFVGSINGSATANTAITGSITIDVMKRNGISSSKAASIESVASSGGQIMPPVMGAAAFFMASLLAIPFVDVLIAGVIPALVFYIPVVMGVHYGTKDQLSSGSTDLSEADTSSIDGATISPLTVAGFAIPFLLLIYLLAVAQYGVMYSALLTVTAMVLSGLVMSAAQNPPREALSQFATNTLDGSVIAAKTTASLTMIIVSISLIVELFMATGIPSKIALAILQISGGVLALAVVLALAICIVIGMGMPTGAAYLLVAVLVAPTLTTEFGITDLAAHFFVMYGAVLSALTPPIAVGVIVASGIADSGFWETAKKSIILGFPLFLLPIVFIFQPDIAAAELSASRFLLGLNVLVGMIGLSYALNRPFDALPIAGFAPRAAFVGLGLVSIFSPVTALAVVTSALVLGLLFYLETLVADPIEEGLSEAGSHR